MSKVSSRIPTFRSKAPTRSKDDAVLGSEDLGKRVCTADKEGVLRYVGNVHFSTGLWCGIELDLAHGKNDGLVHGVRYFACPSNRGLMAPLSKVALITPPDDASGPYSVLVLGKEPANTTFNLETPTKNPPVDQTLNIGPHHHTYDLANDSASDSGLEVKRRKPNKIEKLTLSQEFTPFSRFNPAKLGHSTPFHDFEDTLLRKLQSTSTFDDDGSKRDSLECEESLGILTPEQMADGMSFLSVINSRTPSIGDVNKAAKSELPSPNLVDASVTDFSFGILDEHFLNNVTCPTDTTMNLDLPLDSVGKSLTRLEQTPSPEELPLDPTPIVESDSKTEPSKSKTSSFITSITSITSLDTGYQGDGEMSRPASRGAEKSPPTRRPQVRRPDPMTDSDFYTESDADNHEENPLRGDRHAQVIDGTLYGVDPQAAADIYVNNRENMDSSGIFTDLESSRLEDANLALDVSPSDTSTKTISGNSQTHMEAEAEEPDMDATLVPSPKDNPKKRNAPSPVVSSPSSVRSPRHLKDEGAKKFKMPKREVVSKVKAMLAASPLPEKKAVKKPAGRWDAVMNKISKTEVNKTNLKEVKSKVYTSPNAAQRPTEVRKGVTSRQMVNPNAKLRRVRTRTAGAATTAKSNVDCSIHSSCSDLSATTTPPKNSIGSAKNKREVVQVTQVLTPSKLSPRPNNENKKVSTLNGGPQKRSPILSKEAKKTTKDCGRVTGKGGRTSPVVRPPVLQRAPAKPAPRVAEALAVLVQHLVFNVEAYQAPTLKKEVQKFRQEAEEIRLACHHLEETLSEERAAKAQLIDAERTKWQHESQKLIEKHHQQITLLNEQHDELERRLTEENEVNSSFLRKQNEEKLKTLNIEFQKLQKTHEESLDILREENDSIREQIDEKNAELGDIRYESRKLKEDYEAKESKIKEQLQYVRNENLKLRQELTRLEEKNEERLKATKEESARLREENDRLLGYNDCEDKGISIQEVQSLRVVLELKQTEVSDLRRALAEATQKNELLTGAEERAAVLNARCEDLQLQLERKSEYEQNLLSENRKLHDSFKEEINQKKRLCQYNEELQWKLKQNKEVVSKVLEQAAEETNFNRSLLSASFNERHNSNNRASLERTLSFRDKSSSSSSCKSQEVSPPTSPKVKGVVEKSDWVSYVLDMDESPEIVASRILRRSFRNSTPPKTTPTKSPSNRRSRSKNPLSLSASASAILPSGEFSRGLSEHHEELEGLCWASSTPKRDLEEDELEDLQLPALPSEMGHGGAQALPSPKHLAGEAMISESNSEDESTSSSSVQL